MDLYLPPSPGPLCLRSSFSSQCSTSSGGRCGVCVCPICLQILYLPILVLWGFIYSQLLKQCASNAIDSHSHIKVMIFGWLEGGLPFTTLGRILSKVSKRHFVGQCRAEGSYYNCSDIDDREEALWCSACVTSLAWSRNGHLLVSAATDGTAVLWDVEKNTPVRRWLFGRAARVQEAVQL